MSDTAAAQPSLARVPTGIPGLDEILRGGLFKAGIYVLVGAPGVGKTIFANQIAYSHARHGGRVSYVTLLAETHGRMLAQMQGLSFYDPNAVGDAVQYVNGFAAAEAEGLAGLLKLLRSAVRDQRADLLVLDGMMTAESISKSSVDYKKFINELQTWVGVIGCTVIFLTSAGSGADAMVQPEHSMVDGILELKLVRLGLRAVRQLAVTKFRGSGYSEGAHSYLISSHGAAVYPRVEGHFEPITHVPAETRKLTCGVPELDRILGGGLTARSTTLLIGPSGSGKTTLGLQFLAAGAQAKEPALHFGFYETEPELVAKGRSLGLDLEAQLRSGGLQILWRSPSEPLLDVIAHDLLRAVRERGVKRLFLDGMVALNAAPYRERIGPLLSVLTDQLSTAGVTTLITEEPKHVLSEEFGIPLIGVSAVFQNMLHLDQVVAGEALRRVLAVRKTRDSAQDRRLFEFEIGDRGIEVGAPFAGGVENRLGGKQAGRKPRNGRRE